MNFNDLYKNSRFINENCFMNIKVTDYVINKVLNENEMEKPKIKISEPGSFTEWCNEAGFPGVTCECICKALKTDSPRLHKKAIFAYNFGFKKNGKKCACVEAIERKKNGK